MSGTREGGKLAAKINKDKYGEDFYQKIGTKGGGAKHPNKGFGNESKRASEAGRKGALARWRKHEKRNSTEQK